MIGVLIASLKANSTNPREVVNKITSVFNLTQNFNIDASNTNYVNICKIIMVIDAFRVQSLTV